MRCSAIIAAGLLTLTTGVAANAQQSRHQQQYCGSLASFKTNVAAFDALGPNSTVGEVRAVAGRIQQDAKNVTSAAGKMSTPAAKQFSKDADKLRADANSIPKGATVAEARAGLQNDVQNVKSSAHQLAIESGCPQVTGTR
jgi:hypothetical protein